MARIQRTIQPDEQTFREADSLLVAIDKQYRGKAVDQVLRKIGKKIASKTRAILPAPGYPGDKPGLKPLRETLKTKVVSYQDGSVKVAVVGYTYSRTPGEGGNHGHLLEGGHVKVLWGRRTNEMVQPYEYLIKVVESSKQESHQIMVTGLQQFKPPAIRVK